MKRTTLLTLSLLAIFVLLLASCAPQAAQSANQTPGENANTGMPNPASKFCEDKGGKLEIRTAADGSQSGACIFPDGSECDEWAFYRGECAPASQKKSVANPTLDPAVQSKVVDAIKSKLVDRLKVDPATITLLAIQPVEWRDGCLELATADEMCTQAIVPGFKVTLSNGEKTYTFHTDLEGQQIRQEPQ